MAGQTVIVSVLGDTKPFSNSMSKAGDGVSGLMGKLAPLAGVVAAAFSVRAISTFVSSAVSAASDLEQSIGGLESVFKGSADEMLKWSAGAATAVGLTKDQYNTVSTIIGTTLKAAGVPMEQLAGKTNDLVERGADLAAMFGGTTSDAVGAVGSALRGEFEPLRKYGISLNMAAIQARAMADTGKTVVSELTAQDKALAANALIFESSTDAAGTFGRESNTLAGQQARLTAILGNTSSTLGGILLPALTAGAAALVGFLTKLTESAGFEAFVSGATDLVTGLTDGSSSLGDILAPLSSFLGFLSPLGLILKLIVPMLPMLAESFGGLASTLGSALMGILPTLSTMLETLVGVLAGAFASIIPVLVPLIVSLVESLAGLVIELLPKAVEMFSALVSAIGPIVSAVLPPLLSIIVLLVGIFTDQLVPIIVLVATTFGQIITALAPLLVIVVQFAGVLVEALVPILAALLPPILAVVGAILQFLLPILVFVIQVIANVVGAIVGFVTWINALATGNSRAAKAIEGVWKSILDWFSGIPGKIKDLFSGAGDWLVGAGKNIINGLLSGAGSLLKTVGKFFLDMLPGWIVGPFKLALGIQSPSRLFAGLGENVIAGLENGLSAPNSIRALMSDLSGQVEGGFTATLSAPTGYRAVGLGNRSYQINVDAIAPSAEVGRVIVAAIDDYERVGGKR